MPRLYNETQKLFYKQLCQGRLPEFFGSLYTGDLVATFDFLQACVEYIEHGKDRTLAKRIKTQIRQQFLQADIATINNMMVVGCDLQSAGKIDGATMLRPYCCAGPDDYVAGSAILNKLLDTQLIEDIHSAKIAHYFTILALFLCVPEYTNTWLAVVNGVKASHENSRRAFRRLVSCMNLVYRYPRFVIYDSSPWAEIMAKEEKQRFADAFSVITNLTSAHKGESNPLPVPSDCLYFCRRLLRQMAEPVRERVVRFVKLVAWFGAYEDYFQELASEYWKEILSNPKCWINPSGRDLVRIDIQPLRDMGHRFFQLLPGDNYPNFVARHWIYHLSGDESFRTFTDYQLKPGVLCSVDPRLDQESFPAFEDKLRHFICVHSLWMLTTGQLFKKRKFRPTSGGEQRRKELERSFLVRPHFRWLPPDYHPSERALERSQKHWQTLPPRGKTFVMSDLEAPDSDKLRRMVQPQHFDDSQAPLIRYTEADLDYVEST